MTLDLISKSKDFEEIQSTLDAVLPYQIEQTEVAPRINLLRIGTHYVIRTGTIDSPAGGVKLLANSKPVALLQLTYKCQPDSVGKYLAVRSSTFQLVSLSESTPLLRLDFMYKPMAVPSSHWNIHAERGATSVLLARCNPKHSGLVSEIHLPVGGARQRPCLEDFLEMLVVEFNIDRKPTWRSAINEGRERWRKLQARSIIRDVPEIASEVLSDLGYKVTKPESGHPNQNSAMLRCR